MTDLQAIADCRAHWNRMIAQVEIFIENKIYYGTEPEDKLEEAIGETFYAKDCALCKKNKIDYETKCEQCPLFHINEKCYPLGVLVMVVNSKSWPEWKHNAETYMLPALDRAEQFCRDRGDTE